MLTKHKAANCFLLFFFGKASLTKKNPGCIEPVGGDKVDANVSSVVEKVDPSGADVERNKLPNIHGLTVNKCVESERIEAQDELRTRDGKPH